jgi:hypothetical protein
VAADDKRFYEHKGIDERGLIRAFIGNLAQSGRPQGGSTITQQIVKNILVGEDLTYERRSSNSCSVDAKMIGNLSPCCPDRSEQVLALSPNLSQFMLLPNYIPYRV